MPLGVTKNETHCETGKGEENTGMRGGRKSASGWRTPLLKIGASWVCGAQWEMGSLDDIFTHSEKNGQEVRKPLAAGHTFCLLCVALKRGQGGTGEGGIGSSCL